MIEQIRNNKSLKGTYALENTQVKVIGVGDKALKVLVFETSKFTSKPIWKQYWINFDDDHTEPTKKLFKKMLDKSGSA